MAVNVLCDKKHIDTRLSCNALISCLCVLGSKLGRGEVKHSKDLNYIFNVIKSYFLKLWQLHNANYNFTSVY